LQRYALLQAFSNWHLFSLLQYSAINHLGGAFCGPLSKLELKVTVKHLVNNNMLIC